MGSEYQQSILAHDNGQLCLPVIHRKNVYSCNDNFLRLIIFAFAYVVVFQGLGTIAVIYAKINGELVVSR